MQLESAGMAFFLNLILSLWNICVKSLVKIGVLCT